MTEFIATANVLARTLIVGLGETGAAAARWCARNEVPVRIADTRAEPPGLAALKESLGQAQVEFELGCEVFSAHLLDGVDRLVLSPGLAPNMSPVRELLEDAKAANVEVIGEIELFARALKQLNVAQSYSPRIIGITGTNGKTTVTAWTRLMLQTAGINARVAGNISPAALHALMDAMDQHDLPDVWVLELSSFQLETTSTLRMQAAVVLNVTQDHLDWHGDMESYVRAKVRIFGLTDLCLVNRDDPRVMAMIENINAMNVRSFGRDQPMLAGDVGLETSHDVSWFVSAEITEFADETAQPVRRKKGAPAPVRQAGRLVRLMPVDALSVRGLHNALNCQAAMLLARAAGASWSPMLRAAHDYTGEAHRMAFVRSIRGIDFFNDSKGTNVGATVAGLEGLGRRSVLIAGGVGKGQDFSPLVPVVTRHVKAVVLIGQDAPVILDTLATTGVPCLRASDMTQAVRMAFEQAAEGDAVVLSPACASLDMFRNYPHRGQTFIDEVNDLALDQGEVV
jgi:UDP-N-acetylmuramoylalanine--D-glutamate ligase